MAFFEHFPLAALLKLLVVLSVSLASFTSGTHAASLLLPSTTTSTSTSTSRSAKQNHCVNANKNYDMRLTQTIIMRDTIK